MRTAADDSNGEDKWQSVDTNARTIAFLWADVVHRVTAVTNGLANGALVAAAELIAVLRVRALLVALASHACNTAAATSPHAT